jgi:hypothetical protein
LTVGFRPQLVVVSGLSVGIPLTVGFRLSRSLWLSRSPFHELFFHTMEFRLSQRLSRTFLPHDGISAIAKPFTNFSFTRWNFNYHEAFQELFFHMMEFRLSQSLSQTFLSHHGILAITKPLMNFSFTRRNFGYHRTFHVLFFHIMEF